MFERFTDRARQVVVYAQEEAQSLKHGYIGTEHLLLGVLRVEDGLGAKTLTSLEVSLEEVRAQVTRIVGLGEQAPAGQVPFTPVAKKVLELALREALRLGHNYIGTEHILLALATEGDGVAARILLDFGVDADKIRHEVGGGVGAVWLEHGPRGRRWRRPHRWQYHLLEGAQDDLQAKLDELGGGGWELVLRLDDGRLVFKRPCR